MEAEHTDVGAVVYIELCNKCLYNNNKYPLTSDGRGLQRNQATMQQATETGATCRRHFMALAATSALIRVIPSDICNRYRVERLYTDVDVGFQSDIRSINLRSHSVGYGLRVCLTKLD